MKALVVALIAPFVAAQNQQLPGIPPYKAPSPAGPVPAGSTCLNQPGDAGWPTPEVWKSALAGVEVSKTKPNKSHPQYRLEATRVDQVIAAVKFAREHKVRLSLITSGHDFHARNDAPYGLHLVLSDLRGARISSSFNPTAEGVPPVDSKMKVNVLPKQTSQAYVTFGAGHSTQQLNNLIAPSGLFTVGAAHGEVSVAGGWGQTGGHGPLSTRYGLGVDQFVEFKVVTADGNLKVANSVSNPDLFWALRGGGAGTWGVVVEATMKAYQSPPVSASQAFINATVHTDHKSIYKVAAQLHADFPEWSEKGLSMFYYLYPNGISIYAMNSGPEGTKAWQDKNWGPYLQKLASMPGVSQGTYISSQYADFNTFFNTVWGMDKKKNNMRARRSLSKPVMDDVDPGFFRDLWKRHGPGVDGTNSKGYVPMDSWLLGESHVKSSGLALALEDAMPKMEFAQYRGQMIGGGKVLRPDDNDTSIHPAWRRTYAHLVLVGHGYPDAGPLRKLAPDMGAYVNEASIYTPGWQKAFWGENYDKLSLIKQKYDPEHLFWVTPGIDGDAWTWSNGRVCKNDAAVKSRIFNATEIAPASDNPNWSNILVDDETRGTPFPMIVGPGGISIPNVAGLGGFLLGGLKPPGRKR